MKRQLLRVICYGAAMSAVSSFGATNHVHFVSDPVFTVGQAELYCQGFNYAEDTVADVFRFVCNRKIVYVCGKEGVFETTYPDAVRECFILRAKFR